VSTAIRFDSLLVRALAAELDTELRGGRIRSVRFERDVMRVTLGVKGRRGVRTLAIDLAPDRGWVRLAEERPPKGNVPVARGARIRTVTAPADERILEIELAAPVEGSLVCELMTNQWNALVLGPARRIVRSLRPRGGERPFRPGLEYSPPPRSARRGAAAPLHEAAWRALLAGRSEAEQRRIFIADVAYASPINAPYVLGTADADAGDDALLAAQRRYAALVAEPPSPALIRIGDAWQPYCHPLGSPRAEACSTLLAAFARVAEAAEPHAAAGLGSAPDQAAAAQLAERARRAAERLRKRAARLRAELSGAAAEADRLRADADLLLAQLQRVRRGASEVELDDFTGGTRRLELDPTLPAAENAERIYAAARKRARAAERIPPLVERALADADALQEWAGRVERGAADAGEPPGALATAGSTRKGEPAGPRLPYRAYTTSGGLEVRVGRSGRANDELTLRHASPTDVWLHARDVAGAHVVLRWQDAAANPPQRDLIEAAVLAALHSRARTSGVVAVDWTRRKYVRKPRKAGPGLVIVERAKTIFVEPDPAVAERMAAQ
jgi:predicted ribosome quality control (RQC) complex YloA/Tae2 family protein